MDNNKTKVRCPNCKVQFGFGLSQKYIEHPHKKMKFECAYCKERFSVKALSLFEDDQVEIIQHKIRHRSPTDFQVYNDWDEVRDAIANSIIDGEDSLSVYGRDWARVDDHEELHDIYPPPVPEHISEESQEDIFELNEDTEHQTVGTDNLVSALEQSDDSNGDLFDTLKEEEAAPPKGWDQDLLEIEDSPDDSASLDIEPVDHDPILDSLALTDDAQKEWVDTDPFDIPINNTEPLSEEVEVSYDEDSELGSFIAPSAFDEFLSEEVLAEESKDDEQIFAISEEMPPTDPSKSAIDGLLSTIGDEDEDEDEQPLGKNTLDLLRYESEEVLATKSTPSDSTNISFQSLVEDSEEEPLFGDPQSDNDPFQSEDFFLEDSEANLDPDLQETVIANAADMFAEDSEDTQQTLISHADEQSFLIGTESSVVDEPSLEETLVGSEEEAGDATQDTVVSPSLKDLQYDNDDWGYETEDEEPHLDESEDFDETEEDESQSVLHQAFLVSPKNIARRQKTAFFLFMLFGVLAAILFVRNFPILDFVQQAFRTASDQELVQQQSQALKKQNKLTREKEQKLANVTKQETEPAKDSGSTTETKIETKSETETKKDTVTAPQSTQAKEPIKKTPKVAVASKTKKTPPPPKNSEEEDDDIVYDVGETIRSAWLDVENRAYPAAKNKFLAILRQEKSPHALLGLGYTEERQADRYSKKDPEEYNRLHNKANDYYCAALFELGNVVEGDDRARFLYDHIHARLRNISRDCT